MVEIKSKLGTQQKESAQTPLRTFTVNDPTQEEGSQEEFSTTDEEIVNLKIQQQDELEKRIKELHKQKLHSSSTISPGGKRRIEMLTGIGRATKDVEIDGHVFTLRTLKSQELREVVTAAKNASDNFESTFEARTHTLARAIFKIDGEDIGLVLGDNSIESKLIMIQELDETIINVLQKNYSLLVDENNKKYGLTNDTPAVVKEVVEDLKKSS